MTAQPHPRTPNLALRRVRQAMRLSQTEFAEAIRAAGNAMGVPNRCTKRLVQKWESGEHVACRPGYLRVLQALTGLSVRELGFHVLPPDSEFVQSVAGAESGDPGADPATHRSSADRRAAVFAMSGITGFISDTMLEDSMERLRYALDHPSKVDSRTADFVDISTARLFDLERHCPARLLAPTVERHLASVTSLLTAARNDGVRKKLMLAAGRSAALAGWLAFDRN